MISEKDLIFLSFLDQNYSRSGVLVSGIQTSRFVKLPKPGLRLISELIKIRDEGVWNKKILVVMSPAHILVPFIRMIFRNKIVLDSGWPLFDGELSRANQKLKKINPKLAKRYFMDLIVFHLADAIALETEQQVTRTAKIFGLKKHKLFRSFTGFDETLEFDDFSDFKCPIFEVCPTCNDNDNNLVLFRGKFNREAGLEVLAQSTKELESSNLIFVIATNSRLEDINFSKKTLIIRKFLTATEIAHLYRNSKLSIGQLSDNPRLEYSIPHKAFEAAYFKTPYLTRDASGIREVFESTSDAIFFNPKKVNLSDLIRGAIEDDKTVLKADSAHLKYSRAATQRIIVKNFFEQLNRIL